MITPEALSFMRATQEMIMTSTLVVTEYAEGWEVVDGKDVPRRGPVAYQGKGRLQRSTMGHNATTAGGVPISVSAYVGAVPWNIDLQPGMVVQVEASEDPHAVGDFRISAVEANALALTCRRFHAERVGDNPPIT